MATLACRLGPSQDATYVGGRLCCIAAKPPPIVGSMGLERRKLSMTKEEWQSLTPDQKAHHEYEAKKELSNELRRVYGMLGNFEGSLKRIEEAGRYTRQILDSINNKKSG